MTLGYADYAVIAAYLIAITLFGSWFAKFQKTTRDYFLASACDKIFSHRFASPGARSIGPISSSNRNGSNSEKPGVGKGRCTRKPAPSNVSMLVTIPATVRPLLAVSNFNALLTIVPFWLFCADAACRLVADLLAQRDQCFPLLFSQ